jgi:Domain of unknown function in PX-proteins (DUF3818)
VLKEISWERVCSLSFLLLVVDILDIDGLTHIFATIKTTPDVHELPDNYRAVVEWARISLVLVVSLHFFTLTCS